MHRPLAIAILLCCLSGAACATLQEMTTPAMVSQAHVGTVITVEGYAVNRKIGAELIGDGFSVYIEGLSSWPDGYYIAGDKGRRVRATGILIEAYDLPVFEEGGNSPLVHQGIPVPKGTDMMRARRRYLLKDAKWELIEP